MKTEIKIRVAVLCDSHVWESWAAEALKQVLDLEYTELVLVVVNAQLPAPKSSGLKRITSYRWKRLLWNQWYKRYGKADATQPVSVGELLAGAPRLEVMPQLKGKYSQHFADSDLDKIRDKKPDVILRFGFNILRGEILNVAEHGVWSYHHCDPTVIRGGPGGFWEYVLNEKTTGAVLQRLTEKLDDGIILRYGRFPLIRHSFRENLNVLLQSTATWMAQSLAELYYNGAIREQRKITATRNLYSYPGNFRMICFVFKLCCNKFRFHFNELFLAETWMIGVVLQSPEDILKHGITAAPEWIEAPDRNEYLADPFALSAGNSFEIIAEKYSYRTGKGNIVNCRSGKQIIESEHHLSYPCTFRDGGTEYIIPENAGSDRTTIFNLTNGTHHSLPTIPPAIDPTVFRHHNKWWLFCTHPGPLNNSALFIYYSEYPDREFVPHALNPVKIDIGNSRPAGTPFNTDGKLYYPAQNSSDGYGHELIINEITELTPTSFSECVARKITPDAGWKYNRGIHTLSVMGKDKILIDAKSYRFIFSNFSSVLRRKLRKFSI